MSKTAESTFNAHFVNNDQKMCSMLTPGGRKMTYNLLPPMPSYFREHCPIATFYLAKMRKIRKKHQGLSLNIFD